MRIKIFAIAMTVFVIGGCSLKNGNMKIDSINVTSDSFQKLELTDKEKIIDYFGKPNNIFNKDNVEVYEYNYAKMSNSFLNFVPVVGFLLQMKGGVDNYTLNTVYFYFDKNGKVVGDENVTSSGIYPPSYPIKYKTKY
ncbi:hypothetical protein [Endomicrobium proavitum]|uniref:Lipoprotein SmpA/OmlA domain-containing protein n=1 Tax=Endomicrobium proavitum TaxID=1408281 RepID=A0A0G3WHR2_9BACT|nr:hypothetical protein [Endomicrobium proavitum]AKL98191.1 hypothetical protein Epro_0812 [Endomicrobium proavitum]